jgi:hypothetical protein
MRRVRPVRSTTQGGPTGGTVGVSDIVAQIDREISRLTQARALLRGSHSLAPAKKRNLTPEGRRRIAEAVKRRWAAQKKNQAFEGANGSFVSQA